MKYRYIIEWLRGGQEQLESTWPTPAHFSGGFSVPDHLEQVHYFSWSAVRRLRVEQVQQEP